MSMTVFDSFKNFVVVSEVEYYATIGKLDALRELLDEGHSPDSKDVDGYSALHGAAENGHWECCKLLLERGAKVQAVTRDGLTPLDLAEMTGHERVAELLVQYGA